MWAERMRREWQHTCAVSSCIINVNAAKKSDQVTPDKLNPMESGNGGRRSEGIPLNTPDGFAQLARLATNRSR